MSLYNYRVWDNKEDKYQEASCIIFSEDHISVIGMDCETIGSAYLSRHPKEGCDLKLEALTGLQDRKGKLIYEGDIIEIWGTRLTIEWISEDGGFFASNYRISESGQEFEGRCTIVGNINENTEMVR